jgi:hypothetical protein
MDINIHDVKKIEVLQRQDLDGFSIRKLIFHSLQWSKDDRKFVPLTLTVSCFVDEKENVLSFSE